MESETFRSSRIEVRMRLKLLLGYADINGRYCRLGNCNWRDLPTMLRNIRLDRPLAVLDLETTGCDGRGASGILIPPHGSRAFVAATGENVIAVIDLKSLKEVVRSHTGPDGMAWLPGK